MRLFGLHLVRARNNSSSLLLRALRTLAGPRRTSHPAGAYMVAIGGTHRYLLAPSAWRRRACCCYARCRTRSADSFAPRTRWFNFAGAVGVGLVPDSLTPAGSFAGGSLLILGRRPVRMLHAFAQVQFSLRLLQQERPPAAARSGTAFTGYTCRNDVSILRFVSRRADAGAQLQPDSLQRPVVRHVPRCLGSICGVRRRFAGLPATFGLKDNR